MTKRTAGRRLTALAIGALGAMLALAPSATAGGSTEQFEIDTLMPRFQFAPTFSPFAGATTEPTPIRMKLYGRFTGPDGNPRPPLSELLIKTDRNLTFDTEGLPRCSLSGGIPIEESWRIPELCKPARAGHGTAAVSIAFAESASITQTRGVQIYNDGTKGGTTTLFALMTLSEPVPVMVAARIEIKKIHDKRFGAEATVTFPKIAGEGAFVFFNLTIGRRYLYKHRRRSVLTLGCPASGRVLMGATATFADSSTADGSTVGRCEGRRGSPAFEFAGRH